MKIIDGQLFFDNGQLASWCGLVSVTEDGEIYEGYDSRHRGEGEWTAEQRCELAEYQIGLWRKFAGI